jgi:Uma2 family endonuclease
MMSAITLSLKPFIEKISDRDLEWLCRENPEARLETNAEGKLIVMSPTGSLTGDRNLEIAFQIKLWNKRTKLGKVFDSSTGFKLSNSAVRSPDVSWIAIDRWNSLTKEQQRKFAPIDPDFVVELMSPNDSLEEIQQKMQEYLFCGVRLGWLINPDAKEVEIYRQERDKQVLNNPTVLNGEDILPNLKVTLDDIFND